MKTLRRCMFAIAAIPIAGAVSICRADETHPTDSEKFLIKIELPEALANDDGPDTIVTQEPLLLPLTNTTPVIATTNQTEDAESVRLTIGTTAVSTNQAAAPTRQEVQVIVFEPQKYSLEFSYKDIDFSQYPLITAEPASEWLERLTPRKVIDHWAELWQGELDEWAERRQMEDQADTVTLLKIRL